MPSWNIHIAEAEQLLARPGAVAHAVHDANAFLFGNVVPDIFVGYMVPGILHKIPYRVTHCAKPEPIPKPREHEFWDRYVAPLFRARAAAEERARATGVDGVGLAAARARFDLTLGAWAHLMADNIWNTRVNEYLDAHGGKPSEQFRIKKQGDFDVFGKTLAISSVPRETPSLLHAAAQFPQYPIAASYVHDTITVMHEIVRTNGTIGAHAPYRLLTDAFFAATFSEVLEMTERAVAERIPAVVS